MNFEHITGEVYKYVSSRDTYYVKLNLGGIWVNGITVQPSINEPGTIMVNPPSWSHFGRWKHYIEFDPTYDYRRQLEQIVLEIVEDYKEDNP